MSLSTGFPQRLQNLDNENGHGKVTEHAELALDFVINHGILLILPPKCSKYISCLPPLRN